jgi:hypothetical protein
MSINKELDKASGIFFLLGGIASKIQYIPMNIATPFFNIGSLGCYLFAYIFWFISSHSYPDQALKPRTWYAFAPFKQQNIYAAFLGMGAALISIGSLILPILAVPAAWMYVFSNFFATISQYHKLENPTIEEEYSKSKQRNFFSYTLMMSSISLIGALSTTISYAFPAIIFPTLVISSLISSSLGVLGLEYWWHFKFDEHKKEDIPNQHNPNHLPKNLESLLSNKKRHKLREVPVLVYPSLFTHKKNRPSEINIPSPCNSPY